MSDDDEDAYAFTNDDKRIAFTAIGVVFVTVVFFAVMASIADQSWEPIINVLEIGGLVIATSVFFYYVVRGLWAAAKLLFPDNNDDDDDNDE